MGRSYPETTATTREQQTPPPFFCIRMKGCAVVLYLSRATRQQSESTKKNILTSRKIKHFQSNELSRQRGSTPRAFYSLAQKFCETKRLQGPEREKCIDKKKKTKNKKKPDKTVPLSGAHYRRPLSFSFGCLSLRVTLFPPTLSSPPFPSVPPLRSRPRRKKKINCQCFAEGEEEKNVTLLFNLPVLLVGVAGQPLFCRLNEGPHLEKN